MRTVAIALMAVAGVGFVATLVLGAFVLDKYNAYGEVPIPGSGKLHLPAGRTTVSFHTLTVGDARGGLPVPNLRLDIDPPPGTAEPQVSENVGGSTSVNNDVHRRVWVADVRTGGDYIITTSGDVNGYISPRLAFGHDSDANDLWLGLSAGVFIVGLAGTVTSSVWLSRSRRSPVWPVSARHTSTWAGGPVSAPSGTGVQIEQLKTLAALRDSGALTEKEFQAEKRRVLYGH